MARAHGTNIAGHLMADGIAAAAAGLGPESGHHPQSKPALGLPPAALDHYFKLESQLHQLRDLSAGSRRRRDDAGELRRAAERDLINFNEEIRRSGHREGREKIHPSSDGSYAIMRSDGGPTAKIEFIPGPSSARIEIDGRIAKHKREEQRWSQSADGFSAKGGEIDRLLKRIDGWLSTLPKDAKILEIEPPALTKKESPQFTIERLRGQVEALQGEIDDCRWAPRPSSEVKADLSRQLDVLAGGGVVDVLALVEGRGGIKWPTTRVTAHNVNSDGSVGTGAAEVPNAGALLAWLLRDQLQSRLEAEIDGLVDDEVALSVEERRNRLADLGERLLEVERAEEAACRALEEQGLEVIRRADCDPRAVLSLSGDLPPVKERK